LSVRPLWVSKTSTVTLVRSALGMASSRARRPPSAVLAPALVVTVPAGQRTVTAFSEAESLAENWESDWRMGADVQIA
jgi:hypothetical protein